jgi:5-methylcytosine-specific restriction endonuclease McrA
MDKKSLFTPTKYPKDPFHGSYRCRDCEKENADYFFNIDYNWTEWYCLSCLISNQGIYPQPICHDLIKCGHCNSNTDSSLFLTVVGYSGGGGVSFCKKCSKELVDFIENLGGTVESTSGCLDETAYVSKQEIKNWIRTKTYTNRTRQTIVPALKHECLKNSNYKCDDCGISKDDCPLEVDHIISVAQGGSDELDNLQTLCRDCNAAKDKRSWVGGEI